MALARWEVAWLMPLPTLAALLPERPPWMGEAACRDEATALFFATRGETVEQARAVCAACPARGPCLDYALSEGLVGVWGGTTDQERRAMRRAAS